ncbi:MAG: hypothetical protein U9P68_07025 [Pseudomonadota bacterium]|nr:hypothetical protein [Pseudomonadota bacterium]
MRRFDEIAPDAQKTFDAGGGMRLPWQDFASAAHRCRTDGPVMTHAAMDIAGLSSRTGNGSGGLGRAITGGLGTTTITMITTTTWKGGAAGVR